MPQLNLFTSIECHYCGQNPGSDPDNPYLWHGFFDAESRVYVCHGEQCKMEHYSQKINPLTGATTRSEMPVPLESLDRFKTGKQ